MPSGGCFAYFLALDGDYYILGLLYCRTRRYGYGVLEFQGHEMPTILQDLQRQFMGNAHLRTGSPLFHTERIQSKPSYAALHETISLTRCSCDNQF